MIVVKMTLSFDVTRHKLVLGTRDSTTGWYDISYTESTIEAIIQDRGATTRYLPAGLYVKTDALMMTADPVLEGDKIEQSATRFYEVETVAEVMFLDSFVRRDCDLTLLPLHGLFYSTTAPTVKDARYNTKDYWETYLDSDNLQSHSYIVCYSDPPYPLVRVFKDKNVAIIFAVSQPTTEEEVGHDLTPVGYEEHVPTHVLTLDTELQWLAEAELRRIIEEHPLGSIRTLERKSTVTHNFGSTQIFDTTFTLNYWRDLT
jgi:hypothetical protein